MENRRPAAILPAGRLLLLLLIFITACSSDPESKKTVPTEGMDSLIKTAAKETLKLLPKDKAYTLAVSYFTQEKEISGISEYLIQGLTTEIATAGRNRVTVVSRQAVDRILEEYSFQMSELVDEKSQVLLGKQIGADLILTGFITPLEEKFSLNAQLIEVETGIVLGGYIEEFIPEKNFDAKLSMKKEAESKTVQLSNDPQSFKEGDITTYIVDNFNTGITTFSLSSFEDFWGERIISRSADIDIEEDGGADGSAALAYRFGAEFDREFSFSAWEDSDIYFYLETAYNKGFSDYHGISLLIKPTGCSRLYFDLKQEEDGEYLVFSVAELLNEGEWQEVKIPFGNFFPTDGSYELDPSKPVTFEIGVPYIENLSASAVKPDTRFDGTILIDDLGFYSREDTAPGMIDSFNGPIQGISFNAEVYESFYYMDYSESGEGSVRLTPGIDAVTVRKSFDAKGVSGTALQFSARVDTAPEFSTYVDAEREMGVSAYSQSFIPLPPAGDSLTFYVKAEGLKDGYTEIYFSPEGETVYHEFPVSKLWSKITVPLNPDAVQSSLADIYFYFAVSPQKIKDAVSSGSMEFSLFLDEIRIE